MKDLFLTTHSTPLGNLTLIGDDTHIFLVEFDHPTRLEKQLQALKKHIDFNLSPGSTKALTDLKNELSNYFCGTLKTFTTPIKLFGTPFQIKAWKELIKTPYGSTKSYKTQSENIGYSKGFQAIAQANSCNRLSIIVPCHRIISASGALGGYAGGVGKKKWLLNLEQPSITF